MGNLITLDEFKLDKGLTKSDEDARLEQIISQVSEIIQTYISKDYSLAGSEVTEIIDLCYDSDVIFLENYPIDSIVEITTLTPHLYDSTVFWPLEDAEYILDGPNGKLYRTKGIWPQGRGVLKVTYKLAGDASAGADNVPATIRRAAIDLVAYYRYEEYKDSKSTKGSTINNSTGSGNKNVSDTSFPPHIQRVLDLYR